MAPRSRPIRSADQLAAAAIELDTVVAELSCGNGQAEGPADIQK